MAKSMTFAEFMAYAEQNYNRGGDGVVECWDESTFAADVQANGAMTKTRARNLFKLYKDTMDDMMGW